jgi:tetratricopeptide (TPR) repeat protein
MDVSAENAGVFAQCGAALIAVGKPHDAIARLEHALRSKPDLVEAQDNLAWVLATLPPADGGDPVRAVALAQRTCRPPNDCSAGYLDTLGVAYAAVGRFSDAVAAAQKAVKLARSAGQTNLVAEIGDRLQLYRSGRPTANPWPSNRFPRPVAHFGCAVGGTKNRLRQRHRRFPGGRG